VTGCDVSVGCVVLLELCAVLCVWRARGGVHAVMIAHCAVVGAVRDVVRACRACVLYAALECAMCGVRLAGVHCFV
jgi:hypothetical protein